MVSNANDRPRRPRVLLIAEAANPEWVSVPLVGWSHARAIAAEVDVHLVTQVRNREAILRAGLQEGRDFTAIDSEAIAGIAYRIGQRLRGGDGRGWTVVTALESLSYWHFERVLWRRFGAALRAGEFDLVHRLTPLSPTTPSHIVGRLRRLQVPFVLGPLNGGLPWPPEFAAVRRQEREWLSRWRGLSRLLPGHRATRDGAAAILVGSMATWSHLARRHQHKCVYVPENGVEVRRLGRHCAAYHGPPLRVAFVGRLVPYKGADMLLEAAADAVRAGRAVVDIIGDGPERPRLAALVERLGLDGGVTMTGWVDHAELPDRLARCHVLGFPSIREFGGGVVLEAMAQGLVPVVVDYGGPAELAAGVGFAVPMGPRASIVDALRRVLQRLIAAPEELAARSALARARVAGAFTWPAKARQVAEVYRWVLGQRPDKPDFGLQGQ